MTYFASPDDQVRALALIARLALRLRQDAGITLDGQLFFRMDGRESSWQIAPEHLHLLGGLPVWSNAEVVEQSPAQAAASMEAIYPMTAEWMQGCLQAMPEDVLGGCHNAFRVHEAVAVWRAYGHCVPAQALAAHCLDEQPRLKFVDELYARWMGSDQGTGLAPDDIGECARVAAETPVHKVLNAQEYDEVLATQRARAAKG